MFSPFSPLIGTGQRCEPVLLRVPDLERYALMLKVLNTRGYLERCSAIHELVDTLLDNLARLYTKYM